MKDRKIREEADAHVTVNDDRERSAFSFWNGADWALEGVDEFLRGINLNEFVVCKVSFNGFGVRNYKLEFTDDFYWLLRIAIAEGLEVRGLSPAERKELLKQY